MINAQTCMIIDAESQVSDIQKDFTSHFPYLRLKFLMNEEAETKVFNDSNTKNPVNFTNGKDAGIKITIKESMTVAELESILYNSFGWKIAVLRKSANVWLETNFTDSWTLLQQNRMGESIS